MPRVLVDAGPLVALIHEGDRHHALCKSTLAGFCGSLVTVWPAFTEAMYLLGFSWTAQDALWEFVDRGVLSFVGLAEGDAPRIRALMRQYRDLPMDLADAALVRAAERRGLKRVFTLDHKDFRVYRPKGIGEFELIPEV